MRQARKSRHHIFTVALAALIACAAIAPAVAAGDSGGDEYTLNVPGEGNTPINGGSSGGGGHSDPSSSVSPATATDTETTPSTSSTESSATDTSTSSGGGGQNADKGKNVTDAKGGSGGGDKPRANLVPDDETASNVGSSGSDDGGVPIFLIAIAVLAAVCVGVAVWRMRRSDDGTGGGGGDRAATREVDPGAQSL